MVTCYHRYGIMDSNDDNYPSLLGILNYLIPKTLEFISHIFSDFCESQYSINIYLSLYFEKSVIKFRGCISMVCCNLRNFIIAKVLLGTVYPTIPSHEFNLILVISRSCYLHLLRHPLIFHFHPYILSMDEILSYNQSVCPIPCLPKVREFL